MAFTRNTNSSMRMAFPGLLAAAYCSAKGLTQKPVGAKGIPAPASTRKIPIILRFRSASIRFDPAHYVWFRSGLDGVNSGGFGSFAH